MIYVDMDGVLCDFVGAAGEVFAQPNIQSRWPKGEYDIAKVLEVDTSRFWREVDKEGCFLWANLSPIQTGIAFVELIDQMNLPWTILTSPSRNPACAAGKVMWLQRYFGLKFRDFVITPHKHLLCTDGDILIDDSQKNIDAWPGTGVLVPRPWNEGDESCEVDIAGYFLWQF